jgi:Flp pilus assembly pilin Flp
MSDGDFLTSAYSPQETPATPYAAVGVKEKEVEALRPLAGLVLRWLRSEDEEGQTLVEYGLVLALIVLVVFAALLLLGPIVSMFYMDFGDTIVEIT